MTWENQIVAWDTVDPSQLLANPANYRRHPAKQREALRGSLNELGIIAPIIVNLTTGHVLDGHARVEEYITAGVTEAPVGYVKIPADKEGLALLSLDPIAAMAEADKDALDALLRECSTGEEGLQAMLAEMAKDAGLFMDEPPVEAPEPQVDKAEELREKWGTERGQMWQVGKHRVMCGDSTSAEDVGRLLDGAVPALMVTDPPYGVEYDPAWRNEAAAKGQHDDRADWTEAWLLFPGDVAYTWSPPGDHVITTGGALITAGYQIRNQIIWRKPHFPISRGHYTYQHEPCWYAVKKGRTAHWVGDKNASTVWEIPLDKNVEGGHSTQKPLECMARPIRNHEGDVYDPFLGSGTTAVAAEQLNRICYGMEISPAYVAVTLERLAQMGLEPKLT